MKLGFNEANDRFCKNHSVMMDLELCEKYGFDCIDIQSECLNRDLEAGKITLEEMGGSRATTSRCSPTTRCASST